MDRDAEYVAFLQWALPRLRLRWAGFRRVRRQVFRRIRGRIATLGLEGPKAYRRRLEDDESEWRALDACCRVTISRFYRDRSVFDAIRGQVLPGLARAAAERGDRILRVWSAGCASGEEPYTVAILWRHDVGPRFPGLSLRLLATDLDESLIERARQGGYGTGSARDLPADLRAAAFESVAEGLALRGEIRASVEFLAQDIRSALPEARFDLILCRNLVFTYFDDLLQREIAHALWEKLIPGGALALGARERLPLTPGMEGIAPWPGSRCIYRRPERRSAC